MYTRQCGSKEQAEKEIAAIKAEGRKVYGPIQIMGPQGKPVWTYSAEIVANK